MGSKLTSMKCDFFLNCFNCKISTTAFMLVNLVFNLTITGILFYLLYYDSFFPKISS